MRFFSFLLIPLFLVSIAGCFGGGEINIDTPPAFSDAKRIIVVPFTIEDDEIKNLGRRISSNLAGNLELELKDNEWIYDKSDKVRPVGKKVEELGITLEEVYASPAYAAKVGQALNADIIITGMVSEPRIESREYNEHLMRQGRQTGISGTSTYIRTRQRATGKVRVKVIDVATGNVLYNNKILSTLKYWFAYQTQRSGQIIFKTSEEMIADLGLHLPKRIAYKLYPTGLDKQPEEKILRKPDIELIGSGGRVSFD